MAEQKMNPSKPNSLNMAPGQQEDPNQKRKAEPLSLPTSSPLACNSPMLRHNASFSGSPSFRHSPSFTHSPLKTSASFGSSPKSASRRSSRADSPFLFEDIDEDKPLGRDRCESIGSGGPVIFQLEGDELNGVQSQRRRHKSDISQRDPVNKLKASQGSSFEGCVLPKSPLCNEQGGMSYTGSGDLKNPKPRRQSFSNFFPMLKGTNDKEEEVHNSKSDVPLFTRFHKFSRSLVMKRTKTETDMKKLERDNVGSDIFTEKVYKYPKRKKGVVLMIVNFTGELMGYMKDKRDLRQFFESIGYEVHEARNCSKSQMFVAIDDFKREMMKSTEINRVIIVLLSHGDVKGILSCKDDEGILKEMNGDEEVTTTVEEITAEFKHDKENMSMLKGVPKFLIVQACHGQEMAKAAGNSSSGKKEKKKKKESEAQVEDEDICYQPKVPVDSDILILSASTKHNKSFVGDRNGSWLIQKSLAVFRKMHENTEVERMLKAVIMSVSEQRCAVRYEDGSQEVGIQLPTKQSTLRKDLYL